MARQELRALGGNIDDLQPVLEAWCDMHSKYARLEGETAYDYSENSNTSLLVSAANSLKDWTGLSEHYVERDKSQEGEKTKLKKWAC